MLTEESLLQSLNLTTKNDMDLPRTTLSINTLPFPSYNDKPSNPEVYFNSGHHNEMGSYGLSSSTLPYSDYSISNVSNESLNHPTFPSKLPPPFTTMSTSPHYQSNPLIHSPLNRSTMFSGISHIEKWFDPNILRCMQDHPRQSSPHSPRHILSADDIERQYSSSFN